MSQSMNIGIHNHSYDKDIWFHSFGAATIILLESHRKRHEIVSLGAFLLPYAKLGQINVIFGRNRHPGAYVTWGNVTDSFLDELKSKPNQIPDIENLNAGDNFLIFDIVSNLPSLGPVCTSILRNLGNRRCFYGVRFDKYKRMFVLRRYDVKAHRQ